MSILDQQIHYQISDLSEACARYWELRGIARDSRKEMQIELEHHFIQAALDGKSPETVVGPNPAAFAEAWAREMRPRVFRGGTLILPGLTYALSVVGTTALFQQLLTHTSSFTLFAAYLLASNGLCALLLPLEGFLSLRIRTRTVRTALLATIVVLVALIAHSVGMRVNWSMAILNWSWPLTLLLVVLAATLSYLECWLRASQERTSTDRRVALWRWMMTFVGSVALFDLFLGVSSVVVFNVCAFGCRVF